MKPLMERRAIRGKSVRNIFSDDPELLEKYSREWNAKGYDIYEQVNRINPAAVPSDALNTPVKFGTANEFISRRVTLFYDCDAIKATDSEGKSKYPASDEEKASACELAEKIEAFWMGLGARPKKIDSGNGIQLHIKIDLPAEANAKVR